MVELMHYVTRAGARFTDHSLEIAQSRKLAEETINLAKRHLREGGTHPEHQRQLDQARDLLAACDLLECHDATGISLDEWGEVRGFVQRHMGFTILENNV
jgi:hypothetical protein